MNSAQDRIAKLEHKLELVAREIAGLPVALARSGGTAQVATASGLYLCTISSIGAAESITSCAQGTGSVYVRKKGAVNDEVGSRTIFNPFVIDLPGVAAGKTIVYPCQKTHEEEPGEEHEDDEFTILSIDPLHRIAAINGFAEKTSLSVREGGGGSVDTMEWLGGECETP
jgi:hypothetical protein